MYCSLPTFQGFLTFFAPTNFVFAFFGQTTQATKNHGTYSESIKMGLFDETHLLIVGRLYNVLGPPKGKVP